jgi:hypothetical protein
MDGHVARMDKMRTEYEMQIAKPHAKRAARQTTTQDERI